MSDIEIPVGAVGDAPVTTDISSLARDRSFTYVGGSAQDSVAIDVSSNGTHWAPLAETLNSTAAILEKSFSQKYARARRLAGTGSAKLFIAGAAPSSPMFVAAALALGNFATGGVMGTASSTVDASGAVNIAQTTASQSIYPPAPTSTAAQRYLDVTNTGSQRFALATSAALTTSIVLSPGQSARMLWSGAAWTFEGVGNAVSEGGNSFGKTLNLGTNDAFAVNVQANGINGLSVDASGNVTVGSGGLDHSTVIGGTTVASPTRVNVGTGGFGVNGAADPSALLDLSSTTRGFGPPAMTTVQRDAISSPRAGLLIYNTTTGKLNVRGASAWEAVTSA